MKPKNFILTLSVMAVILLIAYAVFNVIFLMLASIVCTFLIPLLFAYLNARTSKLRNSGASYRLDYICCLVFGVIVALFNHFITQSSRFVEKAADYTIKPNVSIQNMNVVTYAMTILIMLGVYHIAKKQFYKKRSTRK